MTACLEKTISSVTILKSETASAGILIAKEVTRL